MPVISVVHPKERSAVQSAMISKRSQYFVLTGEVGNGLICAVFISSSVMQVLKIMFLKTIKPQSRAQNNILSLAPS